MIQTISSNSSSSPTSHIESHPKSYCSQCQRTLPRSYVQHGTHLCLSCRHLNSKLLSIPFPSPSSSSPSPLFDRTKADGKPLTVVERGAAIGLNRFGQSQVQVATLMNCSRQAVSRWTKRYTDTGDIKEEAGRGRARKTSATDDSDIIKHSTSNPFSTPRLIRHELELEVSTRTIDRRLQEAGLFGRVARRKRIFTEVEIKKRLAFAEGYKHWLEKDWERVLFSDEAIVQGEGGHKSGRVWVRRVRGNEEALQSQYIQHTLPHPISINIWACFSSAGVGYSYIYNQSMSAKEYVNIISTHLLPSADSLFTESPREQWYYLQDNAPVHKSKLATKWFHDNGITCIDFPPYSPDLNPIENLWEDIEKRVEKRQPKTVEEIQDVLAEEWANTSKDVVAALAHSVPQRILAVINAKGNHIQY